jgi:hypothetical protein
MPKWNILLYLISSSLNQKKNYLWIFSYPCESWIWQKVYVCLELRQHEKISQFLLRLVNFRLSFVDHERNIFLFCECIERISTAEWTSFHLPRIYRMQFQIVPENVFFLFVKKTENAWQILWKLGTTTSKLCDKSKKCDTIVEYLEIWISCHECI